MSGEVACCSVVCGTLVGVSVFSIMCSELLIICFLYCDDVCLGAMYEVFSYSILFLMPFMLI